MRPGAVHNRLETGAPQCAKSRTHLVCGAQCVPELFTIAWKLEHRSVQRAEHTSFAARNASRSCSQSPGNWSTAVCKEQNTPRLRRAMRPGAVHNRLETGAPQCAKSR